MDRKRKISGPAEKKGFIVFQRDGLKEKYLIAFSLSSIFILSFVYFFFFSNGIFVHQENSSLFIFSSDYFRSFSSKPGGLLVYAGNFFSQFYFNPLYGSLIISGILLLQAFILYKIAAILQGIRTFLFALFLLPSLLMFILLTRYDTFIHTGIGFLIATSWFYLSVKSSVIVPRYVMAALFPILYYITGSFAFIYPAMASVYSIIHTKTLRPVYFMSFLWGIALITFFIFKNILFYQPLKLLLSYPLVFSDYSKINLLSWILSGMLIILPLLSRVTELIKPGKRIAGLIPPLSMLVLIAAAVITAFRSFEARYEKLMHLEKLVYERNWDEIIKNCEQTPPDNIVGQYYYNLSLIEKGQLCSRLFFSSQDYASMSLPLPRDNIQMFRAMYYYYALGLVGEAHHLAYELMVQHGYRPENIKMLIRTELINGNHNIAGRYINILKKTLHYRDWAENHGKMLYNSAMVRSDPELGQKLMLMPGKDFFIMGNDSRNLEMLLDANPSNIRAFESNLARLLLEKNLIQLVSEVKKMKSIGYVNLPGHVEEAVIAYRYFAKKEPDLGGLSVRPQTETRFKEYIGTISRYQGKKELIDKVISSEKHSFWYYLQFSKVKMDFERENINRNIFIY